MSDQTPDGPKPSIPYWHLHTDAEGESHLVECAMTELEWKSLTSAAQWQGPKTTGEISVVFTVLPPGWFGDWHESPKPQWVVPLSGRWYIEAMDGTRVEFGPGGIHYGEDQNTVERGGRKGHLSGVLGSEPCVQMIVQFDTERPTKGQACRIR